MIEDGAREDKAVRERHRDANGSSLAKVAEHTAGRGAVKIESIARTGEECGDDVGLAVHGKSDVADEGFVEDFVNAFAVVDTALRLAHDACALGRRNSLGQDAPHGVT